MEPTVLFRDFEERDIDFVCQCKNDEKLNSMIVGKWHPYTRDEAKKWVYGCMGEHDAYKFWAICTNDEEKRIVGWVGISEIDKFKKSAHFYSQVIGDPKYRSGLPWIEIQQFILNFVFEKLCLYVLQAAESISLAHTISNPACSKPKSMPPIPANKLPTFNLSIT